NHESRPKRAPVARHDRGNRGKAFHQRDGLAAKKSRVADSRWAHALDRRSRPASVPHDDTRQQARDRVSRCNEMIVGETQMEFGTAVDCEKAKGLNVSLARKRGVELALDFLAQDSRGVAAAG